MGATPSELREWVRQRRLADARERAELRDRPPKASEALARGLSLIAYAHTFTPSASQSVTAEDLLGYRRWARLRDAMRAA